MKEDKKSIFQIFLSNPKKRRKKLEEEKHIKKILQTNQKRKY